MKNLITFLLIVSTLTLFSQTTEELLMAKEINELRTNPKSFIGDIEEYIMFQVKSSEDIKNGTSSIKSSDGKKDLEVINRNIEAAKEVIDILENMIRDNKLKIDKILEVLERTTNTETRNKS